MSAVKHQTPKRKSRTRINFDLLDVLTEQELESFEQRAAEAGAESLTDHFLNVTVRKPVGRSN